MIRGGATQRAERPRTTVRAQAKTPRRKPPPHASSGRGGFLTIFLAVLAFTALLAGVIAVKLSQERQTVVAEAERSQANEAAFLAERTAGRLSEALVALAFAAGDLGNIDAEDVEAAAQVRLAALENSPLIRQAVLLLPDDVVISRGGFDPALREAAGRALAASGGFHALPSAEGDPQLVAAAPAPLADGRVGAFVARLDPMAVLPDWGDGRVVILADAAGRPLAMRPTPASGLTDDPAPRRFGIDDATAARLGSGGGAVTGARIGEREAMFAAAPVAAGDLRVYLIGAPRLDETAWRRTLLFYGLLFFACFFGAVGLSAVLLMQMDRLKLARAALGDSERRFRLAIEGARCGVWDWDRKADTVFLTDSLARMLGREEAAVVSGQEFLALFGSQDRERFRAAIRGAAGAGDIDVELQASGLPVWLHMRGRPWSEGGTSGRIVGVAIDVTERKGAQARVQAAESRLRAALESMSESFVLWDSRRRLVLWNRKFRDFFDFSESALKPGMLYADVESGAARAIGSVLGADGGDETYEIELADGRWLHYSERPTADGGLVSVGADITALKRQESALKDSESALRRTVEDVRRSQARISELAKKYEEEKIRAEEANRSKSEFLANMSHELRTPLNAVNGFSEIMLREMFGPLGDQRYVDYMKDIHSSGQHLLALINDILDMSKIEAGKMQLQTEPVSPHDLIEQCLRLMRPRAEEKMLRLSADIQDAPEIDADPRAIKQVLLNLMSNAVKFTPEGGRVTVRAFETGEGVAIQIVDTGIGIAKEDLPRLGRPFEQIESQHSKSHQGSGLGLALSKSLVEMHGGTLTIESVLGEGATVTFVLPFAEAPEQAATPEESALAPDVETSDVQDARQHAG